MDFLGFVAPFYFREEVIFIALAVSSQANAHLTSIMNEARLLNPIRLFQKIQWVLAEKSQ